jgi:hypothetical protein
MRKFNDIYSSFAANALNYDSSAPNQRLRIEPWLLQLYIDNGLRFPAGGICDGLMPQIYVRINQDNIAMAYHADWDFFFINNTGASPEQTVLWSHRVQYSPHTFVPNAPKPAPTHTFNECLESMKIREIMSNAQLMEKQFSSPAKYKLQAYTSEGVRLAFNLHTGIFYAKCKFDMAGNMSYEYFFGLNDPPSSIDYTKPYELYPIEDSGYDIDVSACCYSRTTSIDAVLGGNSIGCFSQKEVNAFLDQIRIAIDQLNNKLSVVSTTLGMYNQDLQQNYSVATSALDATEEAQQKTAKNIR